MTNHDRLAAHELISRWWFNYDEGRLDVCEGLLTMFRPLAEKKNIDLRGQLDPEIPVVRQDPVKLQQILSNLLSNAIKFTPEGAESFSRRKPTTAS